MTVERAGRDSDVNAVMADRQQEHPIHGCVEELTQTAAVGWVAGPAELLPTRVSLYLDDLKVMSVWADKQRSAVQEEVSYSFSFPLKSIWSYCNDHTSICVKHEGQVLPIMNEDDAASIQRTGEHTVSDLEEMLEAGYVINDGGRLQLSKTLDTTWQTQVVDLYRRLQQELKSEFGYDVFIIYGSLLGQVRGGDFIAHDHDFDSAYVSRHTDGPSVLAEVRDIGLCLIKAGLDVEARRTTLHVRDRTISSVRVDLFHLYFDETGRLRMPFGRAGHTELTKESWTGTQEVSLGGHHVLAPSNAQEWVEHIYGSEWRIPNAGFHWSRARVDRAREGLLPPEIRESVYWANFYATRELARPSSFARFVTEALDRDCGVLDIGCGDGRDSFGFAETGRSVLGVDRSVVAVDHARQHVDVEGLIGIVDFRAVDVSDRSSLTEAIRDMRSRAPQGTILFYMRFFLHSIPEEVQSTLMDVLASEAAEGDLFAAEFRTDKDAEAPKVHGKHYRRFQSAAEFAEELTTRYGFTIHYEVESQGLARYRKEDPFVYRVLAARGPGGWKPIRPAREPKSPNSVPARLRRKALGTVKATSPRLYDRLRRTFRST